MRRARSARRQIYMRPPRSVNNTLVPAGKWCKWNACNFAKNVAIPVVGTPVVYNVRCNSQDPFVVGAGGAQPLGYDQQAVNYNLVWDRALKVIFTVTNHGTGLNQTMHFGCFKARQGDLDLTTMEDAIARKGMKVVTVAPSFTKSVAIFVKLKDVYTGRDLWNVTEFSHTFAAAPTSFCTTKFMINQMSGAATTYSLVVKVVIYSRLTQALIIPVSTA